MAARIDRIEREFILKEAGEAGVVARVQAPGRSFRCKLAKPSRDFICFAPSNGEATVLRAWERVAVYFDFRGQAVSFDSLVKKAGHGVLELAWPEAMFRGLLRHWPRVQAPGGMTASLILPDACLDLDCPESREYDDLATAPRRMPGIQPEGPQGLQSIVDGFRTRAPDFAEAGKVVMYTQGRGPADIAERTAAALGRCLFIPSAISGLPVADPYPEGRVVTRELLDDYEGPEALAASPFATWLAERSAGGLVSAVYAPIRYYRYVVGMIRLENGKGRPRGMDFTAVDFAWDFSRLLAAGLDRYGYFTRKEAPKAPVPAAILNASPGGLLLGLRAGAPRFSVGSRVELHLQVGQTRVDCLSRVARRFEDERGSRYGFAFDAIPPEAREILARGLYGSPDLVEPGMRG